MNTSSIITHLLACIDAGDRDALYPLADAMLEAGDPRAAGVLWLIGQRKWPRATQECVYRWYDANRVYNLWEGSNLPPDVFRVLTNCMPVWATYKTASLAILDAAQAVVKTIARS